MSTKLKERLRLVLYVLVLLFALLLDNAAFTTLGLRYIPTVMPIAVACVALWEGADRGSIFGLIGGCLWAWNTELTYFGAWCIFSMTVTGIGAGLLAERFLLQSWKTILCVSAAALFLCSGVFTLLQAAAGLVSVDRFFMQFLPEGLISMVFVVFFYPVTEYISRIGGFHG